VSTARRPSLLAEAGAAALALVLVGIAGWLGYWQYDAWGARRTAEARDLTQLEPEPLADVMGSDDPFPGQDVGRPVTVAGEWLDGGFWVADREHDGREGYWAVSPMAVSGQDAAVLVVRGWSAQPAEQLLPASGTAEVVGWLQPPEGSTAVDDDASDDVFPEIRVADAVQRVDADLFSAYVVADHDRISAATAGLESADLDALPQVGRFTALRNLLYAFEWWVFGAFAAFIWWRWRRDARAGEDDPEEAAAPAEERSPSAG
jgi:cytochrome oxidase assembly protein ShyY1